MINERQFVASAFKTFDLKLGNLAERISFQKTIYLLQNLGSETSFKFVWHNFGPYSQEVADFGFYLSASEIENAPLLGFSSALRFKELKKGQEGDSRFLEMASDIVFLVKSRGIIDEGILFNEVVNHRNYLDDPALFKLTMGRLKSLNLI